MFELPEELIAQSPVQKRGESRLLVMNRDRKSIEHRMVKELPSLLDNGILMVFNNSRVRKARLYGIDKSGKSREFLLLNKAHNSDAIWNCMTKRVNRLKQGEEFYFDGKNDKNKTAELISIDNDQCCLKFDSFLSESWFEENGHIPLPPYIKREDNSEDEERYQTIYAKEPGSAAAPTAGLHFTEEIFRGLKSAGIESAFITLHVGAGTFLPVRSENVHEHKMHEEIYTIDEENASRIEKAKKEKRKILCVGTTVIRCLEAAWKENITGEGSLMRGEGSTSIFIYPPYNFKVTDIIFTNFHTPASTLLMLVAAFAGRDFILDSYKTAVENRYMFYSYGDACLIL